MNAKDSSFSKTNRKERLKLCGNCAHVSFGLNKQEVEFLNEKLRWGYSIQTMRDWVKKKNIKMPGSGAPDLEKKRVVEIIFKHKTFCAAANASVHCVDEPCFLWLPEPTCTLSPQNNHSIRQRVFQELQKNPSLGPKSLCETLGLARHNQNYIKALCTEYKRLLRNKGYLGRLKRSQTGS
jgi:hypothetical protein